MNEPEAPKCFIDLMKKCWDSNPENRPNANEIRKLVKSFKKDYILKEAEDFREKNSLSVKNSQITTHPQAIYTSRLLNPFTKDLSKYNDNMDNCTAEITDFTAE